MLAVDHRDRGNSATWWRPKRPEDSRSSPENSRHSPRRRRGSARRSHQADPRGAACERTPLCPGWAPALRFSPSRLAHCLAFSRAAARRSAREVGGSLRGRTRRIARVLAQFLLKPRHALCQPDDLALITCRQLKQKLDARPPPRVIDRFRLGALHTPKIRPPRPRSLQQAPQMNAYQKPQHLQALYDAPGEIRTPDLRFRRPTLYPAELLAQTQPSLVGTRSLRLRSRTTANGPRTCIATPAHCGERRPTYRTTAGYRGQMPLDRHRRVLWRRLQGESDAVLSPTAPACRADQKQHVCGGNRPQ